MDTPTVSSSTPAPTPRTGGASAGTVGQQRIDPHVDWGERAAALLFGGALVGGHDSNLALWLRGSLPH